MSYPNKSGRSGGSHIPRKRFGQHFLSDGGIVDAIVNAIAPQAGDDQKEN